MSTVYFATKHGVQAELAGRQRAIIDALLSNMSFEVMRPAIESNLSGFIEISKHNPRDPDKTEGFRKYWRTSLFDEPLVVNGTQTEKHNVTLNTISAVGSDLMYFLARLHLQCEHHLYFEPDTFTTLANAIEQGLELSILEADQGWEEVKELFQNADSTVVTYFSGGNSFPQSEDAFDEEIQSLHKESLCYSNERDMTPCKITAFDIIKALKSEN